VAEDGGVAEPLAPTVPLTYDEGLPVSLCKRGRRMTRQGLDASTHRDTGEG